MKPYRRALACLLSFAAILTFPRVAEGQATLTPVFPASIPGLVYIEGEDAVSTNFAREPTMDYSSSGFRTLQLNREPQATGIPFFAEYSFVLEEGGSFALWVGGTPPGPQSELYPSYASPYTLKIDGGAPRAVYRENVDVVDSYTTINYWYVAKEPFLLEKGVHTLRIEVAERRRYDSRYYLSVDALFLLERGSPLLSGPPDRSLLPPRFPRDLQDRSFNNPYISISQYEANIQAKPLDKELYLQLAEVYAILGDYGNALKIVSRGRLVAGDDPRFALMGAKNRIWSGEVEEGLRLYREYLASPGSDSSVWAEAAKVSAWLGKYQDSLALYREALSRFPDDLNLRVNYGLTWLWSGKIVEGEAELAAALAAASREPTKIETLGSIYEVNGYPDKARDTYAEGMRLFPDELALYLTAARAALASNNTAAAATIEAAIRGRFAASDRLDAILTKIEQDSGLKRAALARYEERLAASPDDLELRRELVRAYFWNGRLDDAVKANDAILVNKLYRILLDLEKDLPDTWRYLDFLYAYRVYLPRLEKASRGQAESLSKLLDAWKAAGAESTHSATSKDQTRKDRAAAALAAAESALAVGLANAEPLALRTVSMAAAADAIGEASVDEASKVSADEQILAKLGPWRWQRDTDLAELSDKAARGNSLAAAILGRVDLIQSRPALVLSRASLQSAVAAGTAVAAPAATAAIEGPATAGDHAEIAAPPATPLPATLRASSEARLWVSGTADAADISGETYFAHGPALATLLAAFEGDPSATSLSTDSSFTPDTPDSSRAAIASLLKAASTIPETLAGIRLRADALHKRALARLKVRWYQHDNESADDRRDLAEIYLKLNRPLDAKVQLERVLVVAPGDLSASFTLGRTLDLAGDWSGAMQRYKQVYATDPRFENTASSYNRLARGHADRFSASADSTIDNARTSSVARLEYAAGGTSLMGFGAVYAIDELRIHSPRSGSIPASMNLESLDLSLNLSLARLGATLFGTLGGTVKNRLWSEPSSAVATFMPADLATTFAAAPKFAAGINWSGGPLSLSGSWTFDQIKDSFFPGRYSWYENQGEATASAWFGFQAPSILRSASLRIYGRGAGVYAPFTTGTNLLYTGVAEFNLGFLLLDSPWTILSLGGNIDGEGSQDASVTDYYAPNAVLSAKGGLQLSSWLGMGGDWVAGLSGRAWGGWWRDATSAYPSFEGQARAEFTKGDLSLWIEAVGTWTGDASQTAYWSAIARIGGTIAVPSYIIP